MSDPTSRTRFSSVFPKKAWIISCKTDPDPIWMVWSEFGQTHLGRKQAGVQKLIRLVCGKVQQARYQFAIFRISSVLPQTSRIISCKTSPDPILIWLTVSGFGQTDRPVCENHPARFWPTLPGRSRSDTNRIRCV